MSEKIILWTATSYVIFLAFFSVKVGEFLEQIALNKQLPIPYNSKRTLGFIALLSGIVPLRIFIPEFAAVLFVMYVILSFTWAIIYFDYIAKDADI